MAERPDERIERFRREALPTLIEKYEPQRVLVFGSRARGEALKHSDLDVLVASDLFRDIPWLERAARVILECDIRFAVELLCHTPDEFEGKREELGIVRTALAEGIDLSIPA